MMTLNEIEAALWDMDGVIIDSLQFDLDNCSMLLSKYCDKEIELPVKLIRDNFALAHREFWEILATSVGEPLGEDVFTSLMEEYEAMREGYRYPILERVQETLDTFQKKNIRNVVVSNNTTQFIEAVLQNIQLRDPFEFIIGFDSKNPLDESVALKKKPSPDMHRAALCILNTAPQNSLVIEDSKTGILAGLSAGCKLLGVATGGTTLDELRAVVPIERGYVINSLKEIDGI